MKLLTKILLLINFKLKAIPVFELYKELMHIEKLSYKDREEIQNKKIQEFVSYCYNNVDYYKDLFDSKKILPKNIKTKKDLEKIPLLTKEIVRDNINKFLSREFSIEKLSKTNTSGSTGKPMSFYSGLNRKAYLTAGLWRIYSRSGWTPGENIAYLWGFKEGKNINKTWRQNLKERFSGTTYLSAWKSNDDNFEKWSRIIKKNKSTIIVCYASTGSRFSKWLIENNIKNDNIKGVFCTSERLLDNQKEIISRAFNCKVYNLYGCGEVNHIACTCTKGNMHINTDMVAVELGKADCNNNQPLILTGFTNKAMPFLRYVNGDSGLLIKSKCDCGINTPLMDLSVARLSDVFTFNNGKKYPSLYFVLRLYDDGFEGVELFQFYQNRLDHIYLYIVKNKKFDNYTEKKLKEIVKEIENHIDGAAKVTIDYKDYIQQSISSKHYYAKSDVKNV